jgi:hypothetical protein
MSWIKVEKKAILFVDTSYTSEEEKIAMVYRLPHYGSNLPEGTDKAYLMIKAKGGVTGIEVFKHMIQYTKKHNSFEKSAWFGEVHPIWVATMKVASNYLKHKVAWFKTQEKTVEHLLK